MPKDQNRKQASSDRKLAAILFADIVGYTSLMQKDEAQANLLLEKFHQTLKEKVSFHKGQIINNYGDGCVCTFDSAVDAMNCAKEVQSIFQNEPIVPVRIGLHSGDVMFKENNVYGDSVNIASRIESLGVAGAVLFSKQIKRHISNQTAFKVQSLGKFHFKNVEKEMEVFALANEGFVVPKRNELQGKLITKPSQRYLLFGILLLFLLPIILFQSNFFSKKTSDTKITKLGIVPFRNISGDETKNHFGFGMASEIRTQLSLTKKFKHLSSLQATTPYLNTNLTPQQIGQELEVDYLLMGMFQIVDKEVRVNVELLDTKSGKSIDEIPQYQNMFSDIFHLQSDIANQVLQQFSIFDENEPLQPKYITNVRAYGYYLKGNEILTSDWSSANWEKALEQFENAIQIDSNYLSAWVGLITAKTNVLWTNSIIDSSLFINVQKDMAFIETNFPESWEKNLAKGFYHYQGLHNYQKGYEYFVKVLNENPENSDANFQIATIYKRQLKTTEALHHLKKAINQNPKNVITWGEIAIVLQNQGDYQGAIEAYKTGYHMGYEDIGEFLFSAAIASNDFTILPKELKVKYSREINYYKNYLRQNWENCIAILDSTKNWKQSWYFSKNRILYRKAEIYYLNESYDSTTHYANLLLNYYEENPNQTDPAVKAFVYSLLGKKDDDLHTETFIFNKKEDLWFSVIYLKLKIRNLVLQGNYKEATTTLLTINDKYPSYGDFTNYKNDPFYNQIKKEYPSFAQAVDELKLPEIIPFDAPLKD